MTDQKMDITDNTDCQGTGPFKRPELADINVSPEIELKSHIFLMSPAPCCAQSALPFWAKLSGKLHSRKREDVLASAVVTLYDDCGANIIQYSDTFALEAGEITEFEVKLLEFRDMTKSYSITIEERGSL
ncbi:MAG: hypothetical protein PHU49_05425 [Syntrophorhabdaceae bacterium]|nr:hypothetical protein [Syntrophorhabdaceae bacterium]MDD5243437.1 hypothetical protein [Syntrophorhabdaceae bacterium]